MKAKYLLLSAVLLINYLDIMMQIHWQNALKFIWQDDVEVLEVDIYCICLNYACQ